MIRSNRLLARCREWKCLALRCSLALAVLPVGCTVHPQGEHELRAEARRSAFAHPLEERRLPALARNAAPNDLLRYALLNNADLERQYWDWRAAIEQIPQAGTQKANVMITFNSMISNGTTSAAMNSLGIGNDPMNSITLPNKLAAAAHKALDDARAAGIRFDKARYDLRNKVLDAYYDYALTAENIRLEQRNADLLAMISRIASAHSAAGTALQQDVLRADNELELSRNDLAALQAKLPGDVAAINALLSRAAGAPLDPPARLPAPRQLNYSDAQIVAMAAGANPELRTLAREMASGADAITLAKLDYLPEFGVNASTDLAGMAQSLTGSIMLPVIRYQGINAALDQARANLNALRAQRRQTSNDIRAQLILDLAMLRDTQRQMDLLNKTILPRARQIITTVSNSYTTGNASMLDILDAQRSLVALDRLAADVQIEHDKRLADIQTIAGLTPDH